MSGQIAAVSNRTGIVNAEPPVLSELFADLVDLGTAEGIRGTSILHFRKTAVVSGDCVAAHLQLTLVAVMQIEYTVVIVNNAELHNVQEAPLADSAAFASLAGGAV